MVQFRPTMSASMSFSTAMRIASFTSRRRVRPCSTESKILTSPLRCFITTFLSEVLLRRLPLTSTVYSKSWFLGLAALYITTPLRISLLHANLTDLKLRICKSSLQHLLLEEADAHLWDSRARNI